MSGESWIYQKPPNFWVPNGVGLKVFIPLAALFLICISIVFFIKTSAKMEQFIKLGLCLSILLGIGIVCLCGVLLFTETGRVNVPLTPAKALKPDAEYMFGELSKLGPSHNRHWPSIGGRSRPYLNASRLLIMLMVFFIVTGCVTLAAYWHPMDHNVWLSMLVLCLCSGIGSILVCAVLIKKTRVEQLPAKPRSAVVTKECFKPIALQDVLFTARDIVRDNKDYVASIELALRRIIRSQSTGDSERERVEFRTFKSLTENMIRYFSEERVDPKEGLGLLAKCAKGLLGALESKKDEIASVVQGLFEQLNKPVNGSSKKLSRGAVQKEEAALQNKLADTKACLSKLKGLIFLFYSDINKCCTEFGKIKKELDKDSTNLDRDYFDGPGLMKCVENLGSNLLKQDETMVDIRNHTQVSNVICVNSIELVARGESTRGGIL